MMIVGGGGCLYGLAGGGPLQRGGGSDRGPVEPGAISSPTPRILESESFIIEMAERTQIQLQAVPHMFFSQAVPIQRSRSARFRLENARRS